MAAITRLGLLGFQAQRVDLELGLQPSLFTDGDTFFSPTASATYTLTPSLFAEGDTFFAATVTPGSVNIAPALFSKRSYVAMITQS